MASIFRKILFLFVLLATFNISASHNRSGEIIYKRISPFTSGSGANTTPVYTYSITVIKYFDSGANIADRCQDTVYFGDGSSAVVQRNNGTSGCGCLACGIIVVNDPNFVVKMSTYSTTHTYSGPGLYLVSSTDANRNPGVVNIPNSDLVPFSIQSLIVIDAADAPNSSPVLSNLPVYTGVSQQCFYFNAYAYDADGDSLSYERVPCMSAPNVPVAGYTYPASGSNGVFAIDPQTGLITWCNPQVTGIYNIAFRIREWRKTGCDQSAHQIGYVNCDMQVIILSGAATTFTSTQNFTDGCVVAGSNFTRTISATNGAANQQITTTLHGSSQDANKPPVSTLSPFNSVGNLNSTFSWQTTCAHIQQSPHQIGFLFQSQNKTFYRQFGLKVVPPSPVITNVVVDTGKVTLFWTGINNCSNILQGYNIYRKTGVNSWFPAACVTGVPASAGYQYLGTASPSVTSFMDNNFYSVLNGSTGNYVITAVMKDCSESIASAIKTLTIVIGIKEQDKKLDLSVYPNPFTNSLEIDLKDNAQLSSEISVFSVDGKLVFNAKEKAGQGKITLPLNNMEPGIYLLQVKSDKGTFSHKIIRQ